MAGRERTCTTADTRVLPQLRLVRCARQHPSAYSCDSRGAATTTDTQTRMTADVFVLLDYALSRAYDCRRVRAAAATNTQTRMPADVCVLW